MSILMSIELPKLILNPFDNTQPIYVVPRDLWTYTQVSAAYARIANDTVRRIVKPLFRIYQME